MKSFAIITLLIILFGGFLYWAYLPDYKRNPKEFVRTLIGMPVALIFGGIGFKNINERIKQWTVDGNMQDILLNNSEAEVFNHLYAVFINDQIVTPSDKMLLLEYTAGNYDLLGLIGLLTNDMPRILLGKLSDNSVIRKECSKMEHSLADLEAIAEKYMEVAHTEADEYVFQKVMLEYPYNTED